VGVRVYFNAQSIGRFYLAFIVIGPVKLAHPYKYYGEHTQNMNDANAPQMIIDACKAVKEQVDWRRYDWDGDGEVEQVYVIYAGEGEATGGNADTVWPHKYSLRDAGLSALHFNGQTIDTYACSNEIIRAQLNGMQRLYYSGIGTICHEFSHTLGLPDIYAYRTPAENQDNQGMEFWDIMDGGTEVRNGRVPASYLAWEREVMGWMKIDELKNDSSIEKLKSIDNGGKAYKIVNPNNSNEYIVLQSMQKGAWNQGWGDGTYGKGLLAYRVSYQFNKVNVFDFPNNVKGKPRVIPIPADGKILAAANAGGSLNTYIQQLNGDPYPYNGNNKIDKFTMYDGTILKRSISDIVENDAERHVSFKFINNEPEPTGIQSLSIVERSTSDNRIYTLDGRYVGTDASILPHGIYIQNNKKFVK